MTVEFAIIDSNTLSCMGLKLMLGRIAPMVELTSFGSFEEFAMSPNDKFVHYFVASGIFFEHAQYFIARPHRSIVLVNGNAYPHISGLLTLNVAQDEKDIVKSLLQLHQSGMGNPRMKKDVSAVSPQVEQPAPPLLSGRETEVAVLLAKGMINKEIADRLNISITTVISHRKNIMTKLSARSLADVIIYVVGNGIARVEEL